MLLIHIAAQQRLMHINMKEQLLNTFTNNINNIMDFKAQFKKFVLIQYSLSQQKMQAYNQLNLRLMHFSKKINLFLHVCPSTLIHYTLEQLVMILRNSKILQIHILCYISLWDLLSPSILLLKLSINIFISNKLLLNNKV